ncbi:hypothetical protein NE237_014237 [Protea cynaroides]|uniref:GST C-terminal domain-containing protein n=1 Tax=Protea cynaroides TaxID=273540 RepID=A0A9Q0GPG8_9MAGN|nr:hypothetical protein NE237_014237 [Protea cynaroides]
MPIKITPTTFHPSLTDSENLDCTWFCFSCLFNLIWFEYVSALEQLLKGFAGRYATGDEVFLADLFLAPQIHGAMTRFKLDMVMRKPEIVAFDSMYGHRVLSMSIA